MGGKRVERASGRGRDPGPGVDWSGAWKSWVAKDAIKPVNMAGCRPPAHAFDARKDQPMNTTIIGGPNAPCRCVCEPAVIIVPPIWGYLRTSSSLSWSV